jgi:hypothetical protein
MKTSRTKPAKKKRFSTRDSQWEAETMLKAAKMHAALIARRLYQEKGQVALGKLGGSKTSVAKTAAARVNARKGGWPKGRKRITKK